MYPEWVHTTFLSFITKTWGIAEILNALYSSLFGSSSTSKGHFFPFTRDLTLAIALASSIDTAIIRTLFFQESSKSFNASSSLWQGLHQVAQNDTITGNTTLYAGWKATDVPETLNSDNHFAYIVGYEDGTVRPNANISRAEVAAIFFRLLKDDVRDDNLTANSVFTDVALGKWYNKSISTMAKIGIVKGRTANTFVPNAAITRAEFAAICSRFDRSDVEVQSNFNDISGHWAENEIRRAASLGWIQGYTDGSFKPDQNITRAEAASMINRMLHRLPETVEDLLDGMVQWQDNNPSDWYYINMQEATNSHDFKQKGEINEHWTKLTANPDWDRYK